MFVLCVPCNFNGHENITDQKNMSATIWETTRHNTDTTDICPRHLVTDF